MVMVSEVGKYRVHSVGRRIYGTFRKKRRSYSSWSYNWSIETRSSFCRAQA